MNSSDAFIKAALYEQCSKSSILKHVDLDNTDTETLRSLINKNNMMSIRKIPILLAKFITRTGFQFAVTKFPKLNEYIRPEHIQVRIEDDEMAYLLNKECDMPPNIIVIVIKNIAINMLGTSIESFASDLHGMNLNDTSTLSSDNKSMPKATNKIGNIRVVRNEENDLDKLNVTPPRTFTTTFDSTPSSPKQLPVDHGMDENMKSDDETRCSIANSVINNKTKLKRLNSRRMSNNSQYSQNSLRSSRRSSMSSSASSISKCSEYRKKLIINGSIEDIDTEIEYHEKQNNAMDTLQNSTYDETNEFLDSLIKTPESSSLVKHNSSPQRVHIIEDIQIMPKKTNLNQNDIIVNSMTKTSNIMTNSLNQVETVLKDDGVIKNKIDVNSSKDIQRNETKNFNETTNNSNGNDNNYNIGHKMAVYESNNIDYDDTAIDDEDEDDDDDEYGNDDDSSCKNGSTIVKNTNDNDDKKLNKIEKVVKCGVEQLNTTTLNTNVPDFDGLLSIIDLRDEDDDIYGVNDNDDNDSVGSYESTNDRKKKNINGVNKMGKFNKKKNSSKQSLTRQDSENDIIINNDNFTIDSDDFL
ncbi:GrBNV_gp67-like protein [Drosophila innubila nudivirus]|uniref:GrBNV_gp67-like protein n=1 Tax=Drosophila innubila nudivirus TaxID=2057187 RepID=A0A2H4UXD9_9VIRU|nr:GrBNV_gp67-like protein [Drosophila innubila nudivirus]ATZ81583.1 GrBNV_gp67-like protein [Drosophila innubila nudivirus]